AREPGASGYRPPTLPSRPVFQSPPGPRAGCDRATRTLVGDVGRVAIPTLPDRRVRPCDSPLRPARMAVSIPTRPESRVRHGSPLLGVRHRVFQSPPGPRAGCDALVQPFSVVTPMRFNPHPAREPGATARQHPAAVLHTGFNPHPAREPGATNITVSVRGTINSFNPHPAREPGATR